MSVATIIRNDYLSGWQMFIGWDTDAAGAAELVDDGHALPGPSLEAPTHVRLERAVELDGTVYGPGELLRVGEQVSELEALVLLRGWITLPGVFAMPVVGPVG